MKSHTSLLGVVCFVVFYLPASYAQTFTVQPGKWSSPSTWSTGIVPSASDASIIINHDVVIPDDTVLTIDDVSVNATLTIARKATVTLNNARGVADCRLQSGRLNVFGKLICTDSATFSATSSSNTFFYDSAVYEHRYFNSAGEPPLATWADRSVISITGFVTGKSLTSTKWNQSFGTIIYDCPLQKSGTFLDVLGNWQTIKGDLIFNSTNAGVVRLTLDKTALTTMTIAGNFIIAGKSQVWCSRNGTTTIHVGGDFVFRSTSSTSSYLTTAGKCDIVVNGNFLSTSTGTLRFASSAGGTGRLFVKNNFQHTTGTLTALSPGKGLISLSGVMPQTATATSSIGATIDIEMNNPSGISVASNTTFPGNVTCKTNTLLHLPSGTTTLQGNFILEAGAHIRDHAGTLVFSGNAAQTLDLKNDTLNNINISKGMSALISLASGLNLRHELKFTGSNLSFNTNGYLTLLSLSDGGTADASIASLQNGNTVTGDVTVQRYMEGEGKIYRYISSSITNASIADCKDDFPVTGTFTDPSTGSGIRSTSPSVYVYDETQAGENGWMNYPATGLAKDNPLEPGRGYAAYIRRGVGSTVWDVKGPINQQEITMAITFTNTSDLINDGWNLVGNPYPSAINWDNATGWQRSNIDNKIVVRDNGSGSFRYWVEGVGNAGSGKIAKGQAFWVQASGDNPVLKINELAKTAAGTPFFRSQENEIDFIDFSISNDSHNDHAFLRLHPNATAAIDHHDVKKWNNDFINLSIDVDSISLALNAVPYIDCNEVVPLTLVLPRSADGLVVKDLQGTYAFDVDRHGVFKDVVMKLIDHYNNTTTIINEQPYSFEITSDSLSAAPNRFQIQLLQQSPSRSFSVLADTLHCSTSRPFSVTVDKPQVNVRYALWLNEFLLSDILAVDENKIVFDSIALPVNKSRYDIVAYHACEIRRSETGMINNVERITDPVITQKDQTLLSSYQTGNHWYFDGAHYAEDVCSITPIKSGIYSCEVIINGCIASSSYDYIHQGEEVQCYPVPANNQLTITVPAKMYLEEVVILDHDGRTIQHVVLPKEIKQYLLSLEGLDAGAYLLKIKSTSNISYIRVVKM